MVVLTCPKPIPKVNLVLRPKHSTAFVGFTPVNNQGERISFIATLNLRFPCDRIRPDDYVTTLGLLSWLAHESLSYQDHQWTGNVDQEQGPDCMVDGQESE
ncbi:hypothetical protein TNCV_4860141 [Trichonephila clavipes]|nr:hypothetical protein TNCV_4860141 [Trichonephila clavipes]